MSFLAVRLKTVKGSSKKSKLKTRAQKEQAVTTVTEKTQKAKAIVFADYKGMTMPQISALRKNLKPQGAEFQVTKNTLLDISLKQAAKEVKNNDIAIGATATLFAYEDEISPIKTLVNALKEFRIGAVKGGFLGNTFLTAAEINQLSALPGKAELQGKIVGVLAAPLQGMVSVLNGNLRNLAYTLDQIRRQKGGE